MIPLKLPVAASGQRDTPDELPSATINVLPDRRVTLAGKPIAIDALQDRLAELRRASGADVRIRIRLDRELPYEALEPALVACAKAEIWNVQLSVFREEASR
jgi:biopolymer transport protein ExbD